MFADIKRIEAEWKARMHKALSFDGVDDYVEGVSDYDLISDPREYTVSFWFKTSTTAWESCLVGVYESESGIDYKFLFNLGIAEADNYKLGATVRGSDSEGNTITCKLLSNNALNDGKWHFATFVVVFNNTARLYVDGILNDEKSVENLTVLDGGKFKIATQYIGGHYSRFYEGLIGEVRIYNRALSESEIKYLYHNPFDPIDSEHLVLWLNPAGIDIVNSKWWDLSGKGNHGTIHGATEVSLVEEEVIVQ